MTPEQFDRLPGVMQDIVAIDRELKEFVSSDVIRLNEEIRAALKDLRAERAEKRRYAAQLWGHTARNNGSNAPA